VFFVPTLFGQSVLVVGNTSRLGGWKPEKGFVLSYERDLTWVGSIDFTRNDIKWPLEFKLVIQEASKAFKWEDGENRILEQFPANEALYEGKFGVTDTATLTQGGEARGTIHLHGVQKADEGPSHEGVHNELLTKKAQGNGNKGGKVQPMASQPQRPLNREPGIKTQQGGTQIGGTLEHGLKKDQVKEQKEQVPAEAMARKR